MWGKNQEMWEEVKKRFALQAGRDFSL